MNVTKLRRPPARSGAVLYPGRGLRSFLRMQLSLIHICVRVRRVPVDGGWQYFCE